MDCPTIAAERWFKIAYKTDGNYSLVRFKKLLAFGYVDASKRFSALYPLADVLSVDLA